jgi:uncharacterized protein YbjT (DUF2867 family)
MTSGRTILITGVTGKQSGAVAQALQGAGFHLLGLTRIPEGERAVALTRQGVDVVKGDLDDEATLAREAGVEHFVYTSVGSAHKRTGIPHFDNKWRIEDTVRGLRFPLVSDPASGVLHGEPPGAL